MDFSAARACLFGCGFSKEQLKKPIVGIIYSPNGITPGHLHLETLAQKAVEGVYAGGGTPIKMTAGVGVCDGIAMGHPGMNHSLPSREHNADAVEIMVRSHNIFDGLILIGACDKNIPGYLMAAARLDLPTIFITAGPMYAGFGNGKKMDVVDSFAAAAQLSSGQISKERYDEILECCCPGAGSCNGLFTANSMACVTEALGLTLPGMATAHATDAKKLRLSFQSGLAVMHLIERNVTARQIITKESFWNALAVDMAIGASTNTVLHIPAIAKEAGIEIDLEMINEISKKVPNLVKLSPSSEKGMTDFDRAGGIPVVMKELAKAGLLHPAIPVNGDLWNCLSQISEPDGEIIRSVESPYSATGGIMILRGNLAPEGAVIKMTGVSPETDPIFTGIAKVFENEDSANEFIGSDKLVPGIVIVIRNVGLAGAPGMPEMLYPTSGIKGRKMDKDVALITDGRFSGGTAGICVGHIAPEAYNGGMIALIKDGDIITINLVEKRIDVGLSDEEIEKRRAVWKRVETDVSNSPTLKSFREKYTV